jgi:hypothetical protein
MRAPLLTFSWVLWYATALLAQVDTGTVSGVVTDQSGGVLPSARVIVRQLETNAQSELDTDRFGLYTTPPLRPGRYEITMTKNGFRAQKCQPFDLRVQDRAEIDFHLEVGGTNTEITVSAVAPLLESETSSLGTGHPAENSQ